MPDSSKGYITPLNRPPAVRKFLWDSRPAWSAIARRSRPAASARESHRYEYGGNDIAAESWAMAVPAASGCNTLHRARGPSFPHVRGGTSQPRFSRGLKRKDRVNTKAVHADI